MSVDQYGLCVICGRRNDHCSDCHKAHDDAWTFYEETTPYPKNLQAEDVAARRMAKRKAELLDQLAAINGDTPAILRRRSTDR